ncbi:MAG: glucosaminidase domain-containing protein [Bacteroidota bacterium]
MHTDKFTKIGRELLQYSSQARTNTRAWLQKNGLQLGVFVFAAFIITQKDLSIQFDLNAAQGLSATTQPPPEQYYTDAKPQTDVLRPISTSLRTKTAHQSATTTDKDDNLANTYSNMTFESKEQLTNSKARKTRTAKQKKQLEYVSRYHKVARREMQQFGIPASITLAQGLIESNCGESKLATRNKNHFGIKCFSRKCSKGHCSNFTDDSHKDFFRIYNSSWDSFRSHSHLLSSKRYRHLKKLPKNDYKGWAKGLKKAGYATDKRYAEKLIHLIETLHLHQYDAHP